MRSYIKNCFVMGRDDQIIGEDEHGLWIRMDGYVVIPIEEYAAIMRDDMLPPCPWRPPAPNTGEGL